VTFVADEGVDSAIVARLRNEGHEVLYVAEIAPSISDDEVLERANDKRALLMTADKDFGELVFRLGRIHTGVVLLRLAGLHSDLKARIVVESVRAYGAEMANAFTVIAPSTVRIRSKHQP
jgi:predicted nuclease of predicted toxin-antitoxin system